jgi:hypothetical protein
MSLKWTYINVINVSLLNCQRLISSSLQGSEEIQECRYLRKEDNVNASFKDGTSVSQLSVTVIKYLR